MQGADGGRQDIITNGQGKVIKVIENGLSNNRFFGSDGTQFFFQ